MVVAAAVAAALWLAAWLCRPPAPVGMDSQMVRVYAGVLGRARLVFAAAVLATVVALAAALVSIETMPAAELMRERQPCGMPDNEVCQSRGFAQGGYR